MAHAGLRKVSKTVRGKHGAVRRSYWVRSTEAVKSFAHNHRKALIAGAVGATVLAGVAYGNRHALRGAMAGGQKAHSKLLKDGPKSLSERFHAFHEGASTGYGKAAKKHGTLTSHAHDAFHRSFGTQKARTATFNKVKSGAHKFLKSDAGKEVAEHVGEVIGGVVGAKLASRGKRVRSSEPWQAGRGFAGAAVGALAGKHIALGIAGAASRRLKAKR